MKILLVSEALPARKLGGLGRYLVALGNALIAAGHDVVLMGASSPDYDECAEELGFHGRFVAGFGSTIKGWKERQLGFFNPWKRPYFAKGLARAIESAAHEFDVVHYHGHLPMLGRYISPRVNFIQSRHDQGGDCIINLRFKDGDVCRERSAAACAACMHPDPGPLRTALSAAAVRRYRGETEQAYARHPVIFVSGFLRDNFHKTVPGARLEKSHVVHNFFDEAAVTEIQQRHGGKAASALTTIHVAGRVDLPKGIPALLDLLVPRLPRNWRVSVCGDGPLLQRVAREHAGPGLRLLGHASHEATLRDALDADVCVVPSLLEEAFGLVTLEALRLGKPCFALARGGTPELARYGAPGQLRLFDTLPELVEALLATPAFGAYTGGATVDVRTHLAALLTLYQKKDTP
jgi:glycogen(starch) synthase